jgi:serine/threonine protein kinase
VAEPEDTGGGNRVTEYTGPTGLVRKATGDTTQEGRRAAAVAAAAIELDDEPTGVAPTPPPGTLRRSMTRAATPNPRFMLELTEGSPVGEYEIQSQIGEGAMGTVYSAVQPLIGKTVAIKVLKPELCANQASIDRFVQEAQAVNRIGHPNIVDVFSLGELPDGRAYFVMEWLRGEDLKSRLTKGPLSVEDTCHILTSIAFALEAAHGKDVVHRDLKPDNVFLHQIDHGPILVKLLDFGIAKLMREKSAMEKTQTGNMLGTPRYISPEQARGIDVTHRSDVYSLGVMAYEMLSGRPPFTGETGMDLVVKHLNEAPQPLGQLIKVPRPLERCVMSMLAKDPAERPTLTAVRRVLADPTQRASELSLPKPQRNPSRKWIAIGIGAALAIAGVVVAWQLTGGGSESVAVTPEPVSPPIAAPAPVPTPAPPPKEEPAPIAQGTIAITVLGSKEAVIFVDGVEWGRGNPIKMIDAGKHEVRAQVKGKPPITEVVTVEAGEVHKVTLQVPTAPSRPVRPVIRRPPPTKPKPTSDLMKPKGVK